jgi:phosphoribosyl-AMP cyclohydrolase
MSERLNSEQLTPEMFSFESFKQFSNDLIAAALFDAQTNCFAKLVFVNSNEYKQIVKTQKIGQFFVSGEIKTGCEKDIISIPLSEQQTNPAQIYIPKAEELDFGKFQEVSRGLISAPIIDSVNGRLLMVGYMDEGSLRQTLTSKKVTFYSRSKNARWLKGETSGNFLYIKSVSPANNMTSAIINVICIGPVCHENKKSCFDKEKFDASKQPLAYTLQAIDQMALI